MQVGRLADDDFHRFRGAHTAIAPVASYQALTRANTKMVPADEIRLNVFQCCRLCGLPVRQTTAKTANTLCQGCVRSELRRKSSLEDIRLPPPMNGKSNPATDRLVHPSWTVQSAPEATCQYQTSSTFHVEADTESFRNIEVLTCFRSEVRRGLRLLSKVATAEEWHMCWAILVSMCLVPLFLLLIVMAGMGFLVLSTGAAIAAAVVYPLAYINPRLFRFAMNS